MDFYCPDRKLIIEADGGQHRGEKDSERDTYLRSKGYHVLRFWNNEINENIEGVWSCILKTLNELSVSPTLTLPLEGGEDDREKPLKKEGDEPLDITRKRLIFRSWHRGTREMDLLMGRFADTHVPAMTAAQLAAYDRLLTAQDPDVYDWYIGTAPVPAEEDSDVVRMFLGFKMTAAG